MRTLTYYVNSSLDGFIAAPDGSYDFYPAEADLLTWITTNLPETLPTHVRAALGIAEAPNTVFDTIVMGRGTYLPGLEGGFPSPYSHLRQYVFAHGLAGVPDDVTVVEGDPAELVRTLKAEDGLGIYLAGGGNLAGQLRDEIDQLIVKLSPITLGTGIPVLTGPFAAQRWERTGTEPLPGGTVVLRYRRQA
ncbi:dihydrofolate reductase family protein [Pseudonocardia yuanmonensis]|uniref:Dihydrofolate reductase family protein n=1 Tax=Pseudonocardia yuanmonensis TaxID=1095914 RepID=A0ABP8WQ93_9PSEU